MPTHVYANGLEITCKAADGVASPAFPDPCWSPPPPPAGPVVIPYSNTARPNSLKNGSCTVFIGGQPVALADQSYFSTSTGNEPATPGLSKGVMSGVIKGKAYFRSWSMNVKIEGMGVARHLDIMTHNHGSGLGNTPPAPYISRAWRGDNDCNADRERAESECGTDDKLTSRHCKGLLSAPKKDAKKVREIAKRLANDPQASAKVDDLIARMDDTLVELQTSAGKNQAGQLSSAARQASEVRDIIAAIKHDKSLTQHSIAEIAKIIANAKGGTRAALNAALASLDKCLLARKCKLVPYKIDGQTTVGQETFPLSASDQGGCCPGQTGHHLITDKMVTGGTCPPYDALDNPNGYHKDAAPTVCVEGENQYHGTHGLIHAKLGEAISRQKKIKNKVQNGTMELDTAITAAAESHSAAFPRSGCSEKCIKAQLYDYYQKACPGARFVVVDRHGRQNKPMAGDEPFA